jgi:hypothetical protein
LAKAGCKFFSFSHFSLYRRKSIEADQLSPIDIAKKTGELTINAGEELEILHIKTTWVKVRNRAGRIGCKFC